MLDDKLIEDLKAKHAGKQLELIEAAGEEIVVYTPSKGEWDRFQSWLRDDHKKKLAYHELVVACTAHPSLADLEAILNRKPALALTIANHLTQMAGLDEAATRKKL